MKVLVLGRVSAAGLVVLLGALACSACTPAKRSERVVGRLGGGVVATVGDMELTADSIGRVAAAQRLSADEALRRLSEDAVLAAFAQRQASPGTVRNVKRTVLARLVLEHLKAEAKAKGEPTDAEVAQQVARWWWGLDRPPAARTVHAVIRAKNEADRTKAKAFALRLRERLRGISDADKFIEVAQGFDAGGLEVVSEALPAVAVDGTVVPTKAPMPGAPPQRLASEFAKAANALTTPGELSPVVETLFGAHVIMLLERTSEQILPPEEQRRAVIQDVIKARAEKAQGALLGLMREKAAIEVSRAAMDTVGQVKVGR